MRPRFLLVFCLLLPASCMTVTHEVQYDLNGTATDHITLHMTRETAQLLRLESGLEPGERPCLSASEQLLAIIPATQHLHSIPLQVLTTEDPDTCRYRLGPYNLRKLVHSAAGDSQAIMTAELHGSVVTFRLGNPDDTAAADIEVLFLQQYAELSCSRKDYPVGFRPQAGDDCPVSLLAFMQDDPGSAAMIENFVDSLFAFADEISYSVVVSGDALQQTRDFAVENPDGRHALHMSMLDLFLPGRAPQASWTVRLP